MARVIKKGDRKQLKRKARVIHATCGSLVEFVQSDIRSDRDGRYVICPACKTKPWINSDMLTWSYAPAKEGA